jgi:hypothetical protein
MGGTLSIVIREKNDTVHKIDGWTNSSPYFINCYDFFKNPETNLQEFLINHTKKDFKGFNAPYGYGLLLIDYKTKTLLNLQGYTSYGKINLVEISLAMNGSVDESSLENIKKMYDANMFIELEEYDRTQDKMIRKPLPANWKFKKICNLSKNKIASLIIDTKPWKFKRFEESEEGVLELKKAVEKLGFTFTELEEKIWKEFQKDFAND